MFAAVNVCCVLLLQFHALLLARCPKVLNEMNVSASQHVTRLICQLQTCLLDSRLAGFAPATLALATLSLDLELFVGWHFWLPATVTLQTLAQVSDSAVICELHFTVNVQLLLFRETDHLPGNLEMSGKLTAVMELTKSHGKLFIANLIFGAVSVCK